MTDANNNARGVPTLDQLISERKNLRGFSYTDLENRAGSTISRQRWQQLGSGVRIKEFPEPVTIEAMADALDVDVAEVVLAAARSIGLDIKRGAHSDLAARLPSTSDRLTVVQRDAIVSLVRSITEESSHAEQPATPTPQPRTPGEAAESEKTQAADGRDQRQADHDLAARDTGGISEGEQTRRDMDQQGEAPDPEGPEDGA